MKLSFVIPAYNEEENIGACLESVERECKDTEFDEIEIIVVNNASTDRTKEIASSFKNVKVVDEFKKGIVHARAAGYKASSGDLIANVDSDNVLTQGWVKTAYKEFKKDPELVALSGPLIYNDLPRTALFFVNFFYYAAFLIYLVNRFILRVGSMVQGGNFIIRREAMEKAGGFDTSINFYGEDTDIARRLHKVGRVKFTFALPIHGSGRRLAAEGVVTTGLRYAINYFWMIFFKKPFTKTSEDIRPQNKK